MALKYKMVCLWDKETFPSDRTKLFHNKRCEGLFKLGKSRKEYEQIFKAEKKKRENRIRRLKLQN